MSEEFNVPDFSKLLHDDNFDEMYSKLTNQLGIDLKMLEEDLEKQIKEAIACPCVGTCVFKKLLFSLPPPPPPLFLT